MKSKNTIFVVGSGAVENSWNPVIRAINKTYNLDIDKDGANSLFAQRIYLLKALVNVNHIEKYRKKANKVKSSLFNLRKNICLELIEAQNNGEIKPQNEFREIVEKFVFSNNSEHKLVSTNWDEVINNEIRKPSSSVKQNILQIHGSISNPEDLYLPSESMIENYQFEKELINTATNHSNNHMDLIRLSKNGNRTVLYGISLDPIDAELNQMLAFGWDSPIMEEIIIINPDHKKVANRVKLLLLNLKYQPKVVGYNPNDLNEKNIYN